MSWAKNSMVKVTVIGVGNLGSCIAYEIATRGLADELVLVDVIRDLAEGQAADIEQAIALRKGIEVFAGNYDDVKGSDLVLVAAGKARTPEMKSRLELLSINSHIIKDVATRIKPFLSKECIVITLTNPLDIMNYLMWRTLGIERRRVIGSSSQLDSARFRVLLAKKFHVKPLDIDAYVIGEHGENQVPLFSHVKVFGKPISFEEHEKEELRETLKDYALKVVSKKGATIYAPASNTADMAQAILRDERRLMCCSIVLEGEYGLESVSIGVPAILGRGGAEEIQEWKLAEEEEALFKRGAEGMKKILQSLF